MAGAGQSGASWERCLAVLRGDGAVACPTETLIGLLAIASSADAVAGVLAIKLRPDGQPLAVLVGSMQGALEVASGLSPAATALAERFWPGPLTLLLPARAGLPAALVRDGKVGVRVPGPSPALELVRAVGQALTATSANVSGEPAPADTALLADRVRQMVGAVVEGRAAGGLASTIVDVCVNPPQLVRPGAVPWPAACARS